MKNLYKLTFIILVLGSLNSTQAQNFQEDQRLINQIAKTREHHNIPQDQTQPEQVQLTKSQLKNIQSDIRKQFFQARKYLKSKNYTLAFKYASDALNLIQVLPDEVDMLDYKLRVLGIQTTCKQHLRKYQKIQSNPKPKLRDYSYRPIKPILAELTYTESDYDRALRENDNTINHLRKIKDKTKQSEIEVLVNADEARIIPRNIEKDIISYPANWPDIVKKREKYKDSVIARSPSWIDEEGKEWYVAVYDISDLIYEVPNFESPYSLTPMERYYRSLQEHNEYYRGFNWDIPQNPEKRVGPVYSETKRQQIVDIIKAFTEQNSTPR
ncbi:hypothetical protein LCGC14_0977420 [marine sediment metagenome]|uniref:Uncharacterized protein n=1 Tax=marine sediment metagenome TaxID=412755 RepID=A0A0F9QT79_9ZZZZ